MYGLASLKAEFSLFMLDGSSGVTRLGNLVWHACSLTMSTSLIPNVRGYSNSLIKLRSTDWGHFSLYIEEDQLEL